MIIGLMKEREEGYMYIAHIRDRDKAKQSVKEHLRETQFLAEWYGTKLNLKHVAGLAGLLHDLGKYSDVFQTYLYQAVFEPERATYKRGEVDHATAGGRLLFERFHQANNTIYEKLLAEIVGNAIISHHGNLHDYISPSIESDFLRRVKEKDLLEYEIVVERFFNEVMSEEAFATYVERALVELEQLMTLSSKQSFFLTKFIFSCLIDADRTNTRQFEAEEQTVIPVSHKQLFTSYYDTLLTHLDHLKASPKAATRINLLRSGMSEQCDQFAEKQSGIYTLSIPTGGGKTLASLRYALKHAKIHDKKRIIYIVPFTTIIEQNAEEVRRILNADEHVLEHHSNVVDDAWVMDDKDVGDEPEDGFINKKERIKLAKDNWDAPIIFTTVVQFLNVFYAKGNRNTRRLHNLSHSVLIFDEVQKVPTKCVSLFNEALNFLKEDGSSSVLLCTATQPTLENVSHSLIKDRDGEIVDDLANVEDAFKRVEIINQTNEPMTNEQLSEWVENHVEEWGSTLIVLNTKKVVKELYERLKKGNVPVFHLSTSMCASHRKVALRTIRERLDEGIPFICVTTQLIEAGVDISFKCVIRSIAGLDSIAQAAGRCNRNGEDELKPVYIIDHAEERLSKLKEIKIGKSVSEKIFSYYQSEDFLSAQAMKSYFTSFYEQLQIDLNYFISDLNKDMTKLLLVSKKDSDYVNAYKKKTRAHLPLGLVGSYKTAAKYFNVIDQPTTAVIVPYGEGKEIIAMLESNDWIDDLSKLLKKAQQFTVNVYPHELNELKQTNAVIPHLDGAIWILKEYAYSEEYGLDLAGEGGLSFIEF